MAGSAWHGVGLSTSSFRASVAESSHFGLKLFCCHFLDAATARSMTGGRAACQGMARHARGCAQHARGWHGRYSGLSGLARAALAEKRQRLLRPVTLKRLAARYRQGRVARDTVRQSVAIWLVNAHHADCDALLEQILAGVAFQRI